MHLGLQDTLVRPYFQRDLFSEQSPNQSQNKHTINGHSQLDPICSSSIPPPGKWSHRTKEGLTFLSYTPLIGVTVPATIFNVAILNKDFSYFRMKVSQNTYSDSSNSCVGKPVSEFNSGLGSFLPCFEDFSK